MERDWIDVIISILMIGGLLFLVKIIGYWIERVTMLEKLLEEKERLIKVLMEK